MMSSARLTMRTASMVASTPLLLLVNKDEGLEEVVVALPPTVVKGSDGMIKVEKISILIGIRCVAVSVVLGVPVGLVATAAAASAAAAAARISASLLQTGGSMVDGFFFRVCVVAKHLKRYSCKILSQLFMRIS